MNKEFLKELGLEDEAIESIMKAHGKTIQELKTDEESFKGLQTEKETLEQQLKDLQTTLSAKDEELSSVDEIKQELEKYKLENLKTSIAVEAGIPLELANRLSGASEDEIKADAENLAEFVNKKQPLPLRQTEPKVNDETREIEQMLDELTGTK